MTHQTIEIRTDDGACPAHVLRPDGAGPWPAVLMYMDGIGMRQALVDMAEKLASGGYYVLLPDMFYRAGPYVAPEPAKLFGDEAVRKAHFAKFFAPDVMQRAMRDTQTFLAHLDAAPEARTERIGTTGYCMGGRMSLTAAGTFGERVAAAAAFHPANLANDAPDSPHLLAPQMRARIYVAGAIEDPSFPDEQKQRLDEALTAAKVEHVIETYPARHGWVPSDTPVHDAACAERHWRALFDLFGKALS
jgi:carboxymethylenebutenolidase